MCVRGICEGQWGNLLSFLFCFLNLFDRPRPNVAHLDRTFKLFPISKNSPIKCFFDCKQTKNKNKERRDERNKQEFIFTYVCTYYYRSSENDNKNFPKNSCLIRHLFFGLFFHVYLILRIYFE